MLTEQEVSDIVKGGKDLTLKDVDVVTTATRAIMSGTYAVLSFPLDVKRGDLLLKRKG